MQTLIVQINQKTAFVLVALLALLFAVACSDGLSLPFVDDGDDPVPAATVEPPVEVVESELTTPDPETLDSVTRPIRIIAIQDGRCDSDDSWCEYEESMQFAADNSNLELIFRDFQGLDSEQTAALIRDAIGSEPDGIAVTITDPEGMRDPLVEAHEAGIPLVAYRFGTSPETDSIPYITFFGQDAYISGILVGSELRVRSGGELEQVGCFLQQPAEVWEEIRCAGVIDALTPYGIDVEILVEEPIRDREEVRSIFQFSEEGQLFDIPLFAIVTPSHAASERFYELRDELPLNLQDSLIHATFDLDRSVEAAIDEGVTEFTFVSRAQSSGIGAIRTLAQAARFGLIPPVERVTNPNVIVDRDNIASAGSVFEPGELDRDLTVIQIQHARCDWDPFWCVVEQGAKDAAEELEIDLEILGPSEDEASQIGTMVNLVEEALTSGPDAIVLTIPDQVALSGSIMRAEEVGIPIIAINTGSGPGDDGLPYLSLIAQDEYLAGRQAAIRLSQRAVASENRAVCLNHVGEALVGINRCRGFADTMNQFGIEVDVLSISQDGELIKAELSAYIERTPATNIFLTLGPIGAHPFYEFVRENEIDSARLVHGTFDISPLIRENILSGFTAFSIDQQPYLQGYIALESIHLLLRYGVSPPFDIYPTGPGFIDQSNVDVVGSLSGTYR